jgi:hypothetical protein
MTDYHEVIKVAIAAAVAAGTRFYTAENMAEAALGFVPDAIREEYDAKYAADDMTMLKVLTRRIAYMVAEQ